MELYPKLVKYFTVGWCIAFGLVHVLWIFGYYLGLPPEQAAVAFQRRWFWYYNVFAAAVCFLGAVIIIEITSYDWEVKRHRFFVIACWGYTILLLLRALGGLVQIIRMILAETVTLNWFLFWDIWFLIGFTLFALTMVSHRKRARIKHLF